MLGVVKIASLRVVGDGRSDVEAKVGKKVMQICGIKLVDKDKRLSCSVEWIDDESLIGFFALVNIFYVFDDSDIETNHCDVCKDTHNLFYCNRQYNCSQCSFAAYKLRRKERYKEMKQSGKYVLNKDR